MNSLDNFLTGPCHVLFVKSGCEEKTADKLRELFSNEFPENMNLKVVVPLIENVFIKNRITQTETEILFPGYIFIFALPEIDLSKIISINNIIRFLKQDGHLLEVPEDEWRLLGKLCNENGIVETSIIDFDIDNQIEIINGPLKNLVGNIISVNKHKRFVIVEIELMNRIIRIKLSFEFLNKLESEDSNRYI